MIRVKSLCKSFGNQIVLNNLDLNVKRGSVYGLVGPNGAGKTTLIKHLTGIYYPDQGSVTVDSESVHDNIGPKGKMYYIPDELYFFSQYSLEETARFYAGIYPSWSWERYHLLKKAFSIDTKKRIVKLSKGMQKQAVFWLGISSMPQLMVMDEPVDGLDPVMRKQVWNLMLQDVAERGMTVLVSSHNLRELEDVCDSVGILHEGKIYVEKELDDLMSNIHKLQVAFSSEAPAELLKNFQILSHTLKGSVHLLVIRGDKDGILNELRLKNPAVLDMLPLSLEEIFIYELGGAGYEIKNILI